MDDRVLEKISIGIRSLATSIPVLASFSQAWGEWESTERFRRIDEFFATFTDILRSHQEELFALQNFIRDSTEIPILLEKIVSYVQLEPSGEKRKLLAATFGQVLRQGNRICLEEKLSILEMTNFLGETDLTILRRFAGPNRVQQVGHLDERLFGDFHGEEEPYEQLLSPLIVSLSKLQSRGIIAETRTHQNKLFPYSGDSNDWRQVWRRRTFAVTSFGRILITSLGW